MTKDGLSQNFNSQVRRTILTADWCRIIEDMTAEELNKFPDNPLFMINATAEEYGCELSSVKWDKFVDVRFVKRYGSHKIIWNMMVDCNFLADPPEMETLLRATLPNRLAWPTTKTPSTNISDPPEVTDPNTARQGVARVQHLGRACFRPPLMAILTSIGMTIGLSKKLGDIAWRKLHLSYPHPVRNPR